MMARFLFLFIWGEIPGTTWPNEILHLASSQKINHGTELSIMAGTTTWTPDGDGTDGMCPLLENPQPDCYCLKLNSRNIPKAVHYCLRDFRDCPIYQRFMEVDDF